MQRYKALLEKTKTLFWNRWFTTNRRDVCMDGSAYGVRVCRLACASQRTWAGALRTPDNPSDTRAIYRVWEGQLAGGPP